MFFLMTLAFAVLPFAHGYHPSSVAPVVPSPTPSAVVAAPSPRPRMTPVAPVAPPFELKEVASGFSAITDGAFVPEQAEVLIVLEKRGTVRKWQAGKELETIGRFDVLTDSEQGLLGMAFHPEFKKNRRVYLNSVVSIKGGAHTQVAEYTLGVDLKSFASERILMQVAQPYSNHNAGQLAFGPDGFLYIGLGDGGSHDDPHGNGQNCKTLLGKMLRIDVNTKEPSKPYGIPKDNPFVENNPDGCLPEIWALGLRNPWRYSFDPLGRLIAADVGQNRIEEVDHIVKGGNYGWNVKEGTQCFKPRTDCPTNSLPPLLEYTHLLGLSITGGYVVTSDAAHFLRGKYLFADFVTGRVWASDLNRALPKNENEDASEVAVMSLLGQFPIQPSTFIKHPSGDAWIGDYSEGKIYRLVEKPGGHPKMLKKH